MVNFNKQTQFLILFYIWSTTQTFFFVHADILDSNLGPIALTPGLRARFYEVSFDGSETAGGRQQYVTSKAYMTEGNYLGEVNGVTSLDVNYVRYLNPTIYGFRMDPNVKQFVIELRGYYKPQTTAGMRISSLVNAVKGCNDGAYDSSILSTYAKVSNKVYLNSTDSDKFCYQDNSATKPFATLFNELSSYSSDYMSVTGGKDTPIFTKNTYYPIRMVFLSRGAGLNALFFPNVNGNWMSFSGSTLFSNPNEDYDALDDNAETVFPGNCPQFTATTNNRAISFTNDVLVRRDECPVSSSSTSEIEFSSTSEVVSSSTSKSESSSTSEIVLSSISEIESSFISEEVSSSTAVMESSSTSEIISSSISEEMSTSTSDISESIATSEIVSSTNSEINSSSTSEEIPTSTSEIIVSSTSEIITSSAPESASTSEPIISSSSVIITSSSSDSEIIPNSTSEIISSSKTTISGSFIPSTSDIISYSSGISHTYTPDSSVSSSNPTTSKSSINSSISTSDHTSSSSNPISNTTSSTDLDMSSTFFESSITSLEDITSTYEPTTSSFLITNTTKVIGTSKQTITTDCDLCESNNGRTSHSTKTIVNPNISTVTQTKSVDGSIITIITLTSCEGPCKATKSGQATTSDKCIIITTNNNYETPLVTSELSSSCFPILVQTALSGTQATIITTFIASFEGHANILTLNPFIFVIMTFATFF
ncbi:hypothetical protein, no similarity [Maudiozyma barnettii]|uniref:Uncharacterized protein n=1 Tax=Maudiozyma barnettii TaxID=61262 RepID=A0A8H2VJ14_9SACH|nr:hypothetical protein, no similarity [Kazachstania barnettii]CAB4256460.1 hypothetical protein, no similarity [Kazachstania barnettii]CAD1785069.1 hypothetical protein, no similarity [Kazachstania barnettii]